MGKRATNQAASAAGTKKAKVEPKLDPAFTSVSDAVLDAEQIPERVRAMLVEMLPFSLKFGSDERHALQVMAVDMAEQTLSAKKSALEATVATEDSALNNLKASESQLGVTAHSAEDALAAQKIAVQQKSDALQQATEAETASESTLNNHIAESKIAQDKLSKMQVDTAAIESAFAEHFGPIEEGEGKAHLKKLEPFLKQLEIESTLLTALPSTCGKAKDKRGTFDQLVLVELDKAFKAKIAALHEAITAEGPASIQRASTLQAAEKDHETKKAVMDQSAAECAAADKEQVDRESALSKAKQAVEDFHPQVDEVTGRLANARLALAEFEAGPLTNFQTFKNRVAAPPVDEAPVADEQAADEAAPVEAVAAEVATEQ